MAEHPKVKDPRIFSKKTPDGTLRREVTSPQGEVQAVYDGFTEDTPTTKAGGAKPAGSST